jgi:polyisoprenoid-binding protein YceI
MKKIVVASLLALLAAVAAGAISRTGVPAAVTFHGVGPAGFKIEGTTASLNVTEDDKALTVIVPLKDLTTNNSLRDSHMRDKYLEIAKFPDTRLIVDKAALKLPAGAGVGEGDATGSMTLHGVKKDAMPFHYKATCTAANVCDVASTMKLNMNDFGIVIPVYLGVTMKPDVSVDTSFQAKR